MADKVSVQEGNETVREALQRFVDLETATRNLYWLRARYWQAKGLSRLSKYYQDQAGEDHAQLSADRLLFLGGMPGVDPIAVKGDFESLRAMFLEDLDLEIQLAETYRDAIEEAAGVKDFVTEDIWRGVLRDTEAHVEWLQRQLFQQEAMGEEGYLQTWVEKDPDRILLR